ncbi:MAG: GAF domain-containing protein [Chloroflexi bacterium]|nr:GAF domain-containing protein [Chloroflexota bacterium]
MNQPSPTLPLPSVAARQLENSRRQRALIFSTMLLIANVGLLLYSLTFPFAQVWAGNLLMGFVSLLAASALGLSLRRRVTVAMILLIASLLISHFGINFIQRDLGLTLGVLGVMLISMIATLTLPSQIATRAVLVSIVGGILDVVADVYLPTTRAATPLMLPLILGGGVAALYLLFLFRQFSSFSLRDKLIIITVILTSITALIIGGALLSTVNNALRQQTEARLISEAQIKSVRIEAFLDGVRNDIIFLNKLSEVENYARVIENRGSESDLTFAQRELEIEFANFAQQNPQYDQIRFLDPIGQETVRVKNTPGGIVIVSLGDLRNESDDDYFKNSINLPEGKFHISNLSLYSEGGQIEIPHKPVIHYAVPIYLNGRVYGIIVLNVLAETFLSPLGSGTSSAFLVDDDGYYLYHPSAGKRWGRELKTGNSLLQDDRQLTATATSGINGTYESRDELFAFTPIKLQGEDRPRWFLVSFLSSALAFAPLNEAQRNGLLLLAATILVAGAIIAIASQALAAPLVDLTRVAEKISAGDLGSRARTRAHDVSRTNRFYQQIAGEQFETAHSEDEIDILARTFNTMAAQLQQTLSSLEQRVSERTRDIAIAAEVGQRTSLIRELETLLSESVELIRDRFDLYYVQIYLLDASGKTLVLRAGSGDVGKQLLGRAHRLAVGSGINGSAAASRQPVIVADTLASNIFRPNPLLPNTRSEMSVPLLIGERVLGVLDLQSTVANALNPENSPVFNTLAAQLAIAIENVILFAQAEEARKETEARARRLTQEGWERFLNAVDRSERIGYRYDSSSQSLTPITNAAADSPHPAFSIPILITGEEVGAIQAESDGERQWTSDEADLMHTVAMQVARQIENLRLLTQAEQSRAEAELATRRLTREGWQDYVKSKDISAGYNYDLNQVTPFNLEQDAILLNVEQDGILLNREAKAITQPLKVGYETIGELALQSAPEESARELLTTVADQLSRHIENLRLTEQTQIALSESRRRTEELAVLNEMGRALTTLREEGAIYQTIHQYTTRLMDAKHFFITLYDFTTGILTFPMVYSDQERIELPARPLGMGQTDYVIRNRTPLLLSENVQTQMEAKGITPMLFRGGRQIQSWLGVPLLYGGEVVGAIVVQSVDTPRLYTEFERDVLTAIASQAAIAIENARSFKETQRRAERESTINIIAQKIQGTTSVQGAIQTAIEELGRALKAKRTAVNIAPKQGHGN